MLSRCLARYQQFRAKIVEFCFESVRHDLINLAIRFDLGASCPFRVPRQEPFRANVRLAVSDRLINEPRAHDR